MQASSSPGHPLSASLPHRKLSTSRLGRFLGRLRRRSSSKVLSIDSSWCIPDREPPEDPVLVETSPSQVVVAPSIERPNPKPRPASMFEMEAWDIYLSSRLPVPTYAPLRPDSPDSFASPDIAPHYYRWNMVATEQLEEAKERVEREWRRQAASLESPLARDCLLGAEFLGVRKPMEGYSRK